LVGLLARLQRSALPLLCIIATLILLGGGGILLGNYLDAKSGTPVSTTVSSCQMHSTFTTTTTATGMGSTSHRRHTSWTCQASYELDGQQRTGTLSNAGHDLTGRSVRAYAKGNELLQTATWHRNVGIAMLAGGVVLAGISVYLFVFRGRRRSAVPERQTANPWA
jgi:hypothetical protein